MTPVYRLLTDSRYPAVLAVYLSARKSMRTPACSLLADYAARLEGAGFGQTEDERIALAWIYRGATHSRDPINNTFEQFCEAWGRILDRYGLGRWQR